MKERLQKLISRAGIASRRHAEEMMLAGEVTVNGKPALELGTQADPASDYVKVRGRLINPLLESRQAVCVLVNKPRGYLSSAADPEDRPLVIDLVPPSLGRLYPVGRLDFNSEGLLLLTNDGALANYLTSARNGVDREYEIKVQGKPDDRVVENLRQGVSLEGVRTAPANISKTGETEANTWFRITLREGRNQQVRRMFGSMGFPVLKLRRVRIGGLIDEKLKPGEWRVLSHRDIARLKGPRPGNKRNAISSEKESVRKKKRNSRRTLGGTVTKP